MSKDLIYSWVISDGKLVYGYKKNGDDTLLRIRKVFGVPNGSLVFHSEKDALNAIRDMRVMGLFALFIEDAKPVKVYISKMRWKP